MEPDADRAFCRIVIGCYGRAGHWSARLELRAQGLEDHQICSMGSSSALSGGDVPFTYTLRKVRDLEIQVSSVQLFDRFWPAPHHHQGSLTRWMTVDQSSVLWRGLCADCALLMVSADTAQQQIRNSQIQLKHSPSVVQAFNFAL